MSSWISITFRYGGHWNDNLCYIGGGQSTAYVRSDNILISDLRGNINYFMEANSLSTTYRLHYLSKSRSGRIIKSLLSSDDELARFCNGNAQLDIYVSDEADTSQAEEEVYRPSFEMSRMPTNQYTSQHTSLDESFTQSFSSFDWFANTSQFMPPQQMQQDVENLRNYHAVGEESSDDDDYIEEEVISESDEEGERASTLVSYGTFVEFDAWIRREGGFGKLLSTIMESNIHGNPDGVEIEEAEELSNWLVPVIPEDVSANLFASPPDSIPNLEELSEGSIFNNKDELKIAVGVWHLERGAEFVIPRSDSERMTFKCKYGDRCPFLLRATYEVTFWFVRKFAAGHTCMQNLVNTKVRKVKARVLAVKIARKIRNNSVVMKPRDIMADVLEEYGVEATYSVAMRARNRAIEIIYGGHEQSFQLLPGYLHMLRETNPGTITDLDIGPDGQFRHLFVALGSCRLAYTMCLRPVIVVDGTHLKGRNNGILFVAVTKDGNEQIFPLAYGIGPIENDVSWTWFLSRVANAYGISNETLIVSDAHASISNAVRRVYPNSAHGLCYYHLLKKITRFGKPSAELYKKDAYAYRKEEFDKWMSMLKSIDPQGGAYAKLMEVGVEKWARSQCPVPRYSFLTSNLAESFNNRLLWARRLPICSMIEAIRHIIEKWFDERHEAAKTYPADLTPEATRKIRVELESSRRYDVVAVDESTFKVKNINRTFKVDLNYRACSCKQWEMDQIPCSHAVAAIRSKGHDIAHYVGVYYEASALTQAYSYRVHPVPPFENWTAPRDVIDIRVLAPKIIRQAGRPKSRRYRGPTERTTQNRTSSIIHEASSSRGRASRKCSVCGSDSHTRRGCPYLVRDE